MLFSRSFSTYFTRNHEWLRQSSNIIRIGITEYAQKALGTIVFVELVDPKDHNQFISTNEPIGVVESVKSATDIFSPLAGKIKTINHAILEKPSLLNQDPQGEGWLLELEIQSSLSPLASFPNLLSQDEYVEYCLKKQEQDAN